MVCLEENVAQISGPPPFSLEWCPDGQSWGRGRATTPSRLAEASPPPPTPNLIRCAAEGCWAALEAAESQGQLARGGQKLLGRYGCAQVVVQGPDPPGQRPGVPGKVLGSRIQRECI